jgi:three-Cys-motif partner protein
MALEFVQDAICLSGLTGSRLKCEVIGLYYPLWWEITSGGQTANHAWPTAIVELDAGTGEVYIEETKETILGSSGHALNLKLSNPNTRNLKVILVERDVDCYERLKRVMARRWGNVGFTEGPARYSPSNIHLINLELDNALNLIGNMKLGNALFFFDPLRSVKYQAIENVASKRITEYYKVGTEFIIFVFTSDWFLGRDEFVGLPSTIDESAWSAEQIGAVAEADSLFGDTRWREQILNNAPIDEREERLIELYRDRLHKWFRYVLPMPFSPKRKQVFHLILCSNFETGVKVTRKFYCRITGNPVYAPDNKTAFNEFRNHHPETFQGLPRNRRPMQWLMLWRIIADHEEGICDYRCRDFESIEQDAVTRQIALEWLENKGYLVQQIYTNAWQPLIQQYRLNWATIKDKLGIDPPIPFEPLSLRPQSLKEINQ